MKLTLQTALAIILALSTVAGQANYYPSNNDGVLVVRREALDKVMTQLDVLKVVLSKRDVFDFEKRADTELGNLIVAILDSGYVGEVINTITNDQELGSVVSNVAKGIINVITTNLWPLVSAIWNSGLIGKFVLTVFNDKAVSSALFSIVGSIVKQLFNTVVGWFTGGSSSSGSTGAATTTAPAVTTTAAAVTTTIAPTTVVSQVATKAAVTTQNIAITQAPVAASSAAAGNGNTDVYASLLNKYGKRETTYLSLREVNDNVDAVVSQLKQLGIVDNFLKKLTEDPANAEDFLTQVLAKGVVAVDQVYDWAKEEGLVDLLLSNLQNSGNQYAANLGSWLEQNGGSLQQALSLGNKVADSGNANNAPASLIAPVVQTTPSTVAQADPAAAADGINGVVDVLASLKAAYGSKPTQAKRMMY